MCAMPQSKAISVEHMQEVVDGHQAGKGNKSISKDFGLHQSTVRKFNTIITLPRSGSQTKITPRSPRTPGEHLRIYRPLLHWLNIHHQTNTEQEWCVWQDSEEKTTTHQEQHCCSNIC